MALIGRFENIRPPLAATVEAASHLTDLLAADGRPLAAFWRGEAVTAPWTATARRLAEQMQLICQSRQHVEQVGPLLPAGAADVVMVWAECVAERSDLVLSPLVTNTPAAQPAFARRAAVERVLVGPLFDALHSLPGCWNEPRIATRLSQLVWEAGARAMVLPALGRWAWSHESAVDDLILSRTSGTLVDRVLAARALSLFADGFVEERAPGKTHEVLAGMQPLLAHPEPLVWAPAARALGRFAAGSYSARDQVRAASNATRIRDRRRNATALAAMPVTAHWETWHDEIAPWFEADYRDPWQLAAFAIGTPHLAREQPDTWQSLCDTAVRTGNLELVSSLAEGLSTLQRHAGAGSRELRAARALHTKLTATPQSSVHESARRLDALAKLERALGDSPTVQTCFDLYDQALAATFDKQPLPELPAPRKVFDDAVAALAAADGAEPDARARALLAIRGASEAQALRLPSLVLGKSVGALDNEHFLTTCERILVGTSTDYATRSAIVNVLCDLVAAHDRHHRHGQVAARALAAVASSRWVAEVSNGEAASRDSIRRSRKHFEDLFAVCLDSYDDLRGADGAVSPPLAAWWTLCAGSPRVLGPLSREKAAAEVLAAQIAELERALATAASSTAVASWSPAVRAALVALGIERTTMFAVVNRLIAALEVADQAPRDYDHAIEQLGTLAAACDAMLSIAHDLDDAFVVGTRFGGDTGNAGDTRRQRVTSSTPWLQLSPIVRRVVEPVAQRLSRRAEEIEPFRPEVGAILGGFRLVRRIAIGGMGEVWKAREGNGRLVALKFPRQQVAPEVAAMLGAALQGEAETLSAFSFACVATLIAAGVDRQTPYLAIEFIRGRTLEQHLLDDPDADPHLHQEIIFDAIEDVCRGLDNLHRHGFIHRDLKPANIILRMRGRDSDPLLRVTEDPTGSEIDEAVLVDLGIAHAFDAEGDGCTLGYASPEATFRHVVGPEADLYSLGATLYHLFTGETLLGSINDEPAAIQWHRTMDFRNEPRLEKLVSNVPSPWREIIQQTCLRERAARMPLAEIRKLIRQHRRRVAA